MKTTFLNLIVLAALLAPATLKAQVPYTKTFSIEEVTPTSAGWAYWFIPVGGVADTLDIKMSCVTTGSATHGGHHHNHHELFVALEGDVIVNINGEDRLLHPGDGLFCPGSSEHSIRRADESKTTRYLLFNTQTTSPLPAPQPFWKEKYTADDCYAKAGKKSYWLVRPEQTCNGLSVESVLLSGKKVHKDPADGRQLAYLIIEGTADITVDGQAVQLPAMSVCYVPAGSSATIASAGGKMRYYSVRTGLCGSLQKLSL